MYEARGQDSHQKKLEVVHAHLEVVCGDIEFKNHQKGRD